MATSYCHLLHYNKTKQNKATTTCCHRLLCCNNTKKKKAIAAKVACCHCLFCCNKIKEVNDGNNCHRLLCCNIIKKKKVMVVAIVAFFVAIEPKKEGKELKGRSLPSSSRSSLSILPPAWSALSWVLLEAHCPGSCLKRFVLGPAWSAPKL